MTLANPWIDPRVAQVRPEAVRAYLVEHGWKEVGPASNPHLVRYEVPDNEEAPTLFVPTLVDRGPGLQWMIELIGDLARWQGKFAGDLLTDVLQQRAQREMNGTVPVP